MTNTVLPVSDHVTEVVPAIRAIVSTEGLKTIKVTNSALVEKFNCSAEAFEKVNYPFTPDLIVYCKSKYVYIEEVSSARSNH